MPGNKAFRGNKGGAQLEAQLRRQLPPGWSVRVRPPGRRAADFLLEIRAPRGERGVALVQARGQVDPVDVGPLAAAISRAEEPGLVFSPYLSPRTREALSAAGLGYADLTGNTYLVLFAPAMVLHLVGESRNPSPRSPGNRTLRGPKAGRIVRALCETRPPIGIRALAARSRTDPGYTSRVIDLLRRDGLVERDGVRGPLLRADWEGLIRRLAQDYSVLGSNVATSYLDPRGIPDFSRKLRASRIPYLLTGSLAAAQIAPLAPTRFAICYVEQPAALARELDLRATDTGANVVLIEPADPLLLEEGIERGGLRLAAASQIAADLLTGPGRAPQEAEELLQWMKGHEHEWRQSA